MISVILLISCGSENPKHTDLANRRLGMPKATDKHTTIKIEIIMKKEVKKEVRKIVNWNNYVTDSGETNSGEILVIPDQAYSVEEIFDKFRRGITLNIDREGTYLLEDDSEDFESLDLRQVAKDPYDIDESDIIRRLKQPTEVRTEPIRKERSGESDEVKSEQKEAVEADKA